MINYFDQTQRNGKKLWWGRTDVDGLPFRGPTAPYMPEDEFQERVTRVRDFRNAFFDVTDAQQNRDFCQVMECCGNGWFELFFIERFWKGTSQHYVEWFEYYLEDGRRTPYLTPGASPLGQANLNGHLGSG